MIQRMQSALRDNGSDTTKQRVVIVITGMGGMGKSEVCLKVADLMREEYALYTAAVEKDECLADKQ
jgi:nucleoside-triphosphatase THEP1